MPRQLAAERLWKKRTPMKSAELTFRLEIENAALHDGQADTDSLGTSSGGCIDT